MSLYLLSVIITVVTTMLDFVKKLFGSKHEKDVKRLTPVVDEINALLPALAQLSDDQLREKTEEFRARIREGVRELEEKIAQQRSELVDTLVGAAREQKLDQIAETEKERDAVTADILDDLIPEAFAVVKDACQRMKDRQWKFDLLGNPVDMGYGPVRRPVGRGNGPSRRQDRRNGDG